MNACPSCHLGRQQATRISLPVWFGTHLMIVPHTPVLVCDVCGEMEYDLQFMASLRYIIQQHTLAESRKLPARLRKPAGKPTKPSGPPPAEASG